MFREITVVLVIMCCFTPTVVSRATSEQLDRRLGLGMKHVSCETRITGYYMKRHCQKHFNAPMRCDLEDTEKRKVRKVAELCCDDAPSCEPTELFEEFCCLDGDCGKDCKMWEESVEQIELSNAIFSSDSLFEKIQDKLLEKLKTGIDVELLPSALQIFCAHPNLITENEPIIRKYFKAHRLHTANLAKTLNVLNEKNQLA